MPVPRCQFVILIAVLSISLIGPLFFSAQEGSIVVVGLADTTPSSYRGANLLFHSTQGAQFIALLPRSTAVPSTSLGTTSYPGGYAEVCSESRFIPTTDTGKLGSCGPVPTGTTRPIYAVSPDVAVGLVSWGQSWNNATSPVSEGTLPTFDVMFNLSSRECAELCPVAADANKSTLDGPFGRLAPLVSSLSHRTDEVVPISSDGGPILEYEGTTESVFLPWFPAGCRREVLFTPPVGDGSIDELAMQVSGHRTVLGEMVSTCLSPNLSPTTTANCNSNWANGRLLETRYFCPTMPSFAIRLHTQVNATTTNYRPLMAPFVDPVEAAGITATVTPFTLQGLLENSTSTLLVGSLGMSAQSGAGCQGDQTAAFFDFNAGLGVIAPTLLQLSDAMQVVCSTTVTRNCLPSSLYGDVGITFVKGKLSSTVFPQFSINEKLLHAVTYRLPFQSIQGDSAVIIWVPTPGFRHEEMFLPGLVMPSFVATLSLCEGLRTISEMVNVPNGYLESQDVEVMIGTSSVPFGLGLDQRLIKSLEGWTNLTCNDLPVSQSIDAGIALAVHLGYNSVAEKMRALKVSNPTLSPTTSSAYTYLVNLLSFPGSTAASCFLPETDLGSMPTLYVTPEVPGGSTSDMNTLLFGDDMSATTRTGLHTSMKTYRMIALQLSQLLTPQIPFARGIDVNTASPEAVRSLSTRRGIILHSLPSTSGGSFLRPKVVLGTQVLRNHWLVVDASEGRTGFIEKPSQLQVNSATTSTTTTTAPSLGLGSASDAFGGCVAPMSCHETNIFVSSINKCLDTTCSVVFLEYDSEGLQCVVAWPVVMLLVVLVLAVMLMECTFQCIMTTLYRRIGRARDNELVIVN